MTTKDSPSLFMSSNKDILGCFASIIDIKFTFYVELLAMIIAIEKSFQKARLNLWIECDPSLFSRFQLSSNIKWFHGKLETN